MSQEPFLPEWTSNFLKVHGLKSNKQKKKKKCISCIIILNVARNPQIYIYIYIYILALLRKKFGQPCSKGYKY